MKRALTWIIGIISILLVVVIATGVVLVMKIYEKGEATSLAAEKSKSLSTILNSKMHSSLASSRATGDVDFLFSEEDLEFLFCAMIREIEEPTGISLDGVDVSVDDGAYTLSVFGMAGPLSTVIRAGISFSEERGNFTMTLHQVSAGSLELLRGIGQWILQKVKAETIENSLASVGVFCEIDLSNLTVTFSRQNIIRSAEALAGDEEDSALLSLLLDVFLDRSEILEFRLGEADLLGAVLHLTRLKYSQETYGALPYSYDFDTVAGQVESLIADGKVTESQVAPVFRLLVKGYASLSDEDKATLDGVDLTSVSVTNKEYHTGIMRKEKKKLSDFFLDYSLSFEEVLMNRTFGISVKDDMMTEVFRGFDFVGFSLAFPGDENGKVSYIVIEQFNVTAHRDHLDLQIIVNLNGVQILLSAALAALPTEGLVLTTDLEEVRMGDETLTEEQRIDLLTYLAAVGAESDLLSVEPASETITFDFTSLIAQNEVMRGMIEQFPFLMPTIVVEEGAFVITYAAG